MAESLSILGCCMDLMPSFGDKEFDLAHVDPPYFSGPEKRGYYGKGFSKSGIKRVDYAKTESWELPGPQYFDQLFRISKEQIIWGANYFLFKDVTPFETPTRDTIDRFILENPVGWIIWDKCNRTSTFRDFELAWTSFDKPTYVYQFMWNGAMQGKGELNGHIMQGNKRLNQRRIHPTEKPIKMYRFLANRYCKIGHKVIDTHLGSGSHRIACFDMGIDFLGIEKSEIHFANENRRFKQYCSQLNLFY